MTPLRELVAVIVSHHHSRRRSPQPFLEGLCVGWANSRRYSSRSRGTAVARKKTGLLRTPGSGHLRLEGIGAGRRTQGPGLNGCRSIGVGGLSPAGDSSTARRDREDHWLLRNRLGGGRRGR